MKKTIFIMLLMAISTLAFAKVSFVDKRIARLQDEKKSLSAAYVVKQRELSEITLKIHDIDSQLEGLRGKNKL